MSCINCGTANEDGAALCSNCGESPYDVVENQESGSSDGCYPLSNLTAKLFSVLFEIILWIVLIGGFIGGGILGNTLSGRGNEHTFSGVILGGIVGFVTIILAGGLVSLFIKLVNNSEEVKKQLKDMQRQP